MKVKTDGSSLMELKTHWQCLASIPVRSVTILYLDDKKFTLMGDDGKGIGCLKGLPSGPLLLDFISKRCHKKFTLSQLMALKLFVVFKDN